MEGFLFELMERVDAENLYFYQDKRSGLKVVIAIHNTTLGPAADGIRMWQYASERDAVQDALRLAKGMTYKWAAAGVNLGGGKCVVIGDSKRDKSEELLRSLGRFIKGLNGQFFAGADVGTTVADMDILAEESPYVVPVSNTTGSSSPATALGVLQGMRACLNALYGSPELRGRSVAVQGVGSVGTALVEMLVEAGANVTIADVDEQRVEQLKTTYATQTASPEEILKLPVDIFSPCALGAILNETTIPQLQCAIICGSANNQLEKDSDGELLTERNILYAPDYIVNAGGALWSIDILQPDGFKRDRARATVERIYETTTKLISIAREQGISTAHAADLLAEQHLAEARESNT